MQAAAGGALSGAHSGLAALGAALSRAALTRACCPDPLLGSVEDLHFRNHVDTRKNVHDFIGRYGQRRGRGPLAVLSTLYQHPLGSSAC